MDRFSMEVNNTRLLKCGSDPDAPPTSSEEQILMYCDSRNVCVRQDLT